VAELNPATLVDPRPSPRPRIHLAFPGKWLLVMESFRGSPQTELPDIRKWSTTLELTVATADSTDPATGPPTQKINRQR